MLTNTSSQHPTQHFQRYLLTVSAVGIFLVSAIVAAVASIPLSQRLKVSAQQNLGFAAKTRALTLEEFLSRLKDVTVQITSRTRARQALEAYNRGEVDREAFVQTSTGILNDALVQSEEVVGITRLDRRGNLAVRVGREIPSSSWVVPPTAASTAEFRDPVEIGGVRYLVVGAPILNGNGQRVGTDLVLFDLSHLGNLMEDRSGLGETGEAILGTVRNQQIEIFFPLRNESIATYLRPIFDRAVTGESGTDVLYNDQIAWTVAYQPIEGSSWGLAVMRHRSELYAPLYRKLRTLSFTIVGVTVVGVGIAVLVLRPLVRQSLVQSETLERQVRETNELLALKDRALQSESRKQALVEEALQQIEHLKLSSQDVLQQSQAAGEEARQALSLVQTGASSVVRAFDGTQQTQEQVREIVDRIRQLNEGIDRIQAIAALVKDFSAQTNMLALNAAVEAVRAGDTGKGFGVVAGEIRKLADQSQQSAERIRDLVLAVQTDLDTATNVTASGNETVSSGVQMAQETAQTFKRVTRSIEDVAASTQQITQANQQQTIQIEALVETIRSIL
ncbi:MAG: hypothetical protein J7642_11435 [Cyanobacteria bacterium SBC]|nr:hypothetical protein [Cyanobacteria bacterium SBC]